MSLGNSHQFELQEAAACGLQRRVTAPASRCRGSTEVTAGPWWWCGTAEVPVARPVALGQAKSTLKGTK